IGENPRLWNTGSPLSSRFRGDDRGESLLYILIGGRRSAYPALAQQLERRGVGALVAGRDDASASLRGTVLPGGHDAAGTRDDRVQHPHKFGLGVLGAELLADHSVVRKGSADEGAHGRFGGPIGGRDRIEAALPTFIVHAEHGAEERQDGLPRDRGQLIHKNR